MSKRDVSVLEYNGISAVADLDTPPFQRLFDELEREQEAFLSCQSDFRSPDYHWPRSPLHNWSRAWEYPYVYHAIREWRETLGPDIRPVVADVGSGVTFFPFAIAKLACQVVCTDIDPICETDLAKACELVPHAPGSVQFRRTGGVDLPFNDEECDAVYCISVLEHIPEFEKTVAEIARVLKPDGFCVITCDLDLRPEGKELGATELSRLRTVLGEYFVPLRPTRTIHPVEMLTTHNSPQRTYVPPRGPLDIAWRIAIQKVLKPLLGMKPGYVRVRPAGVLGLTLKKASSPISSTHGAKCHNEADRLAGASA